MSILSWRGDELLAGVDVRKQLPSVDCSYGSCRLVTSGFKLQVQRANDSARAHRLAAGSQSRDIFVGACSADRQWRSTIAEYSRTGLSPWASTDAATRWYTRWSRVATGACGSAKRSGSQAAWPSTCAPPFLCPVIGQRCSQWSGRLSQYPGEPLIGTPGIRSIHSRQQDQARDPRAGLSLPTTRIDRR